MRRRGDVRVEGRRREEEEKNKPMQKLEEEPDKNREQFDSIPWKVYLQNIVQWYACSSLH